MRKLITLLLLSLIAGKFAVSKKHDYQCVSQVPSDCSNNPRFTLSKDARRYSFAMKVCSNNNQCINLMDKKWNCKEVCKICSSILTAPSDCSTDTVCESRVDAFINSHCASIRPTTETISGPTVTHNATVYKTLTGTTVTTSTTTTETETCPVTTTATCSTQSTLAKSVMTVQPSCPIQTQPTVVKTVTSTNTTTIYETKRASGTTETVISTKLVKSIVTIQPLCSALPTTAQKATSDVHIGINSQSSLHKIEQNKPTLILGGLLGLFVLVIVVVIIGWVWTYWSFKRRSGKVKREVNTDETERHFKNPIYGESSSSTTLLQDGALLGRDNAHTQTGGNMHVYDVLNRGQPTGCNIIMAREQSGVYNSVADGSYSKLGLQDKDIENNYHLIEN